MASHTFDHDEDDDLGRFFKAWFAFVTLLALLMLSGSAYLIYVLLGHIGVIA